MGSGVLIDTDILIEYTMGKFELPFEQIYLTEISLYEFVRGTKDIGESKKIIEKSFVVLFHDNSVIKKSSEIWRELKIKGKILDDRDLLIGSFAIIKNLPLLTNNKKHFARLKEFGLRFYET